MKQVLFAVLFLACSDSSGPPGLFWITRGLVAIPAPHQARDIWTELEACSGLRGNFDSVRWAVAPNGIRVDGKWKYGIWLPENIIVLASNAADNYITIKHEEVHALLRGGGNHPAKYFNGVCGDLMSPFMP